jgi:DNA-directed RNA polymerase II subunit RPB2
MSAYNNNNFDWDNESWEVIEQYFKKDKVLVKHHLESYDNFIDIDVSNILQDYNQDPRSIIYSNMDPERGVYNYEYHIKFGEIYMSKPILNDKNGQSKQMYPNDARLRNLSYWSNLCVDVYHKLVDRTDKSSEPKEVEFPALNKFSLCRIPILLGSKYCSLSGLSNKTRSELGECEYDYGGYFIINGSEKAIIMQEKRTENRVYVFKKSGPTKFSHAAEVTCTGYNKPYYLKVKNIQVLITAKEGTFGRTIKVKMPSMRQELPLFVVFRALGIVSDKEIIEMMFYDLDSEKAKTLEEYIRPSIEEARPIQSMRVALEYISKYIAIPVIGKDMSDPIQKLKYTQDLIVDELFPHLGLSLRKKGFYLGYMVNRLITGMITETYDDRDSFINKRISSVGALMAELFKVNFQKMMRDAETQIRNELKKGRFDDLKIGLNKKLKSTVIEHGIRFSLSTGNWGARNGPNNRSGVSQQLTRLSYAAFLSQLNRCQAPIDRTLKSTAPRKLHGTSWGMFCPAETPEGANIGLIKNKALTCNITVESVVEPIYALLNEFDVIRLEYVNPRDVFYTAKIMVNGNWYGIHPYPTDLVEKLRENRRSGIINVMTSITWNSLTNEVLIFTDGGRCTRPLFILKNNNFEINNEVTKKIKNNELEWFDLLNSEILSNKLGRKMDSMMEYIDVEETDCSLIAESIDNLKQNSKENDYYNIYTHCELNPTMIIGVLASQIPLFDRNNPNRVLFQCAQGKSAVGIPASNYRLRMDTSLHVLNYPSKPLVTTKNSYIVNNNEMPSGMNIVVAIASHTGYNQEDSIIFNKSSVEKGMFISTYYHMYTTKEQKNQSSLEDEKFMKPQKYHPNGNLMTIGMKKGSYDKLQPNGFVKEGTRVDNEDVIIGKVLPLRTQGDTEIKYRDASVAMKPNDYGTIDWVYSDKDAEGYKFVKVRIRSERVPEIGDKFASRYGQKGTMGMNYRREDMPFSKDGISPDIIINPHCIPSRMTIAQLIECIMGKVSAKLGCELDGTAFARINPEDIANILQDKCGLQKWGYEVLYNGRTGEQMVSQIFMGPTFYQRLKHMVFDKAHCLTLDHEVLTRDGWKTYGQLSENDLIATLKGDNLVYEKPTKIHYYENYEGKMYHIENCNISLDVTDNHRMLVSRKFGRKGIWQDYGFEYASDVFGKHRRYKKDAEWTKDDYQFILPEYLDGNNKLHEAKVVSMKDWLVFFGIWIAEGWTNQHREIMISVNKQRVKDALYKAIENMGYNYFVNGEKLHITNVQLASYMKQFSLGAPNKYLPDWAFELSKEQTQILITSMQLGDGYFCKNKTSSWYSTTSEKLADQLMQLCLHAGWAGNKYVHIKAGTINKIEGREVINQHDILKVSIIKKKVNPQVNHGHVNEQKIQKEYMYEYKGPVFCLSVPSEIFFVRKDGKAVWTGNSRNLGPYVLLTRQPSEGRSREGGLRVGEMERDALISHGTVQFLKERMFDDSDKYMCYVSKKTGLIAAVNPEKGIYNSLYSDNNTDFIKVQIPYATKLFIQEMMSMSIAPRIFT